jgi:hypothetical protein
MEGSMKMMSWSRYHCLSGSLLRAERRYRAARSHKTWLHNSRQRSDIPHPRPPAFGAGGAQAGYFQFVIRMFRT